MYLQGKTLVQYMLTKFFQLEIDPKTDCIFEYKMKNNRVKFLVRGVGQNRMIITAVILNTQLNLEPTAL